MRILFIGNSHTYYNDMPHMFADTCRGRKTHIGSWFTTGGYYYVTNMSNAFVDAFIRII